MKKQLNLIIYLIVAMFAFNAQANLIVNPGFEAVPDGLTDWTNSGATIRTADPGALWGTNYIFGEANESFTISQEIVLLNSLSSTAIDTGNLDIVFGGWQSGWNSKDTGQISIHLLDINKAEIVGGVTSLSAFTSDHLWVEQSGTTDLLIGTRFIRYEFTGTKYYGDNTDAYLDNAYVKVVPVPAAVWLFGSGLIGLVGIARRKVHA